MALKDCIILVYLDADQFLDLLHWPWSLNCWCSSQTFHSTKIEINFFSSWLYFKKLLRVTYKAVLTFMCLFADTHIPGRYIQEVNKFLGTVCRMLLTVCEDLLQSIFWCPLHGLIGCSTLISNWSNRFESEFSLRYENDISEGFILRCLCHGTLLKSPHRS